MEDVLLILSFSGFSKLEANFSTVCFFWDFMEGLYLGGFVSLVLSILASGLDRSFVLGVELLSICSREYSCQSDLF